MDDRQQLTDRLKAFLRAGRCYSKQGSRDRDGWEATRRTISVAAEDERLTYEASEAALELAEMFAQAGTAPPSPRLLGGGIEFEWFSSISTGSRVRITADGEACGFVKPQKNGPVDKYPLIEFE